MAIPPRHVTPGEAIRAADYNNMIDYITETRRFIDTGAMNVSRLVSACVNADEENAIDAGSPVYIDTGALAGEWYVYTPVLSVLPYDGEQDLPVGVARFDMDPGQSGEVVLRGIAVLNVAAIIAGKYLEPTANGVFDFTDSPTQFRVLGRVRDSDDEVSILRVMAFIDSAGGGIGSLGVITTRPSGGAGAAVWQTVTLDANGDWTASGTDIPVVIPRF